MASKFNERRGELSVPEEEDEMAVPEHEASEGQNERAAASAIFAGIGLAVDVINRIFNALGSVERKIVISLANASGVALDPINIYFFSGTGDTGLPGTIPTNSTLGFGARKTSGPVARGTVGTFTYYIAARNQTACLMWSVPFDYNLYSNWWNFEVRAGRVTADRSLYQSLYYTDSAIKGDSNRVTRSTNGWTFEGTMGHSGTPVLEIILRR